jgi:IclR family mhp operon transcriptional activator
MRLPLLSTAVGRAHLAFCPAVQRESLLEILRRSNSDSDKLAHNRPELDKILEETRARGYSSAVHPRRVSDEITMAVPVVLEETVLGAVVIRFAEKAVPFKVAAERFVPKLHETAHKIRQTFTEQQRNPPYRRQPQAELG